MRTKALCAAALAAGALTSMAQVYSANVVGYVNVKMVGNSAFTMIANPLDATMGGTVANGNNITNLFQNVNDGDTLYRWNPAIADFDSNTPGYSSFTHAWNFGFDLQPGEGIFYNNNGGSDLTITFVGQVVQGNWSYAGGDGGTPNKLMGNSAFNAVGSPFPIGGSFTNSIMGITPSDGDAIYLWDPNVADFSANTPGYSSFTHQWTMTDTVQVAPGIGFFYNANGSADMPWTASFTVQ